MILVFLILADVISNYVRLKVAEIWPHIRHEDFEEGERDDASAVQTAADDVLPIEETYQNIIIPEVRPAQVTEQDPKDLEQCLVSQIRDRSPVLLTDAFTEAVDEAVELAKLFRTDAQRTAIREKLDALVQHFLAGPLNGEPEDPVQPIPIIPEGNEPSVATRRIKRLVNASLALYANEFQQNLHGSRDDVRHVLQSYQMEIEKILIHCLCAPLQLEGDQQLGKHLSNLQPIIKEVGSLVSAKTEGKVRDLVKGRQLPKEVEDILATVMSAVSKEVEVLISINMKQMKSFLNKKRAGVDLTIVAFSPHLTKMERMSEEETVNKFLTAFQSHPHTHQALVGLFGLEVTGDMEPSAETRDSRVGTALLSKRSQIAEEHLQLSEDVCREIGGVMKRFRDYDYYKELYEKGDLIGEGSCGKIYKATRRGTTERYAVKEIKISYKDNYGDETITHLSPTDQKNISNFLRCCQEAALQSDPFIHPNIAQTCDSWLQYDPVEEHSKDGEGRRYSKVRQKRRHSVTCATSEGHDKTLEMITLYLYGSDRDNGEARALEKISEEVRDALLKLGDLGIYVRMDLYDNNLADWLRGRNRETKHKEAIVHQLIEALSYIHSLDYCHGDLSARNILITENKDGKGIKAAITDFELGQLCEVPGQGEKIMDDMRSFGLIVCEIFIHESKHDELKDLIQDNSHEEARKLARNYIADDNMIDILMECLIDNEEQMVTSQDLKERYVDVAP